MMCMCLFFHIQTLFTDVSINNFRLVLKLCLESSLGEAYRLIHSALLDSRTLTCVCEWPTPEGGSVWDFLPLQLAYSRNFRNALRSSSDFPVPLESCLIVLLHFSRFYPIYYDQSTFCTVLIGLLRGSLIS